MVTRRGMLGLLAACPAIPMGIAGIARARADDDTALKNFRRLPKSLWVWNTPPEDLPALVDFARVWNIRTVMLGLRSQAIDRVMQGDSVVLRNLEQLRGDGAEVFALTGDPSWVMQPQVPRAVSAILETIAKSKAFDGIDLDVEPHTLKAWRDNEAERERLAQGHLALFEAIAAEATDTQLGACLHPNYATMNLGDGRNYLAALCGTLRSASLMAYRTQPRRTVDWSRSSAEVFEQARIPWRSGILVHETEEKNISYAASTRSAFLDAAIETDAQLRQLSPSGAWRGLIFEDYHGLRKLLGKG